MMRVSGIVIKGEDKGKKLGYPTANILLKKKMASGVYTGKACIGKREYRAAIFIRKNSQILEVHFLRFSGNLYDKKIEVEIGVKIREAKRFKGEEGLKKQIKKDIEIINKET